jgi:hypothetical protein
MSTLSSLTDKDVDGGLRALQGITGLRAQDIDFARQQDLREQEMLDSLEKMLKDAGIRGQYKRGYTRTNTQILEN